MGDTWKIAMLGSCNVGKSTLARQFTLPSVRLVYLCTALLVDLPTDADIDHDVLDPRYVKPIMVDCKTCLVEVLDDELQEDDPALAGPSVQNSPAQGFILMYSITDKQSFDRVQENYYHLLKRVRGTHIPLLLVGNKCNQQYRRKVSKEEGAALARELGCEFYETSAKTLQNAERTFVALVRLLRERQEARKMDGAAGGSAKEGIKKYLKCVVM